MRPGLRNFGCGIALVLLMLVGISLWVGARIGIASLREASRGQASPSLLGEGNFSNFRGRLRHSVVGEVDSVDAQSLTVLKRDGERRTIVITADTLISRGPLRGGSLSSNRVGELGLTQFPDLQPGGRVVIIGRPRNNGQIEARVIRIIPVETPFDRNRSGPDLKGKNAP